MNPLRYRGYYYDTETGYYYLQSRYYDPSICRFINSDIPEIAGMSKGISAGTNLFAYCNNKPINLSDPTGEFPVQIVIGALIGAVLGAVGYLLTCVFDNFLNTGKINFKKVKTWQLVASMVVGAVDGGISGSNVTKIVRQVAGFLTGFIGTLTTGGTIFESVIIGIISTITSNKGMSNQITKFSKNKVKKQMKKFMKLSPSKIRAFGKAIAKTLKSHFKSNKTLYKMFGKQLFNASRNSWLISFGLGRFVKKCRG